MNNQPNRKYNHLFFAEFDLEGRSYELGIFNQWDYYYLTCYDRQEDEFCYLEHYPTKREVKARLKEIMRGDFKGANEQVLFNPSFMY